MTLLAFKFHNDVASVRIPNANALIKRSGGNKTIVWGNGNCGDTVLNIQVENLLVRLKVPKTDAPVTASGCNDPPITSEVKGINVLLVAGKLVFDSPVGDIPYLANFSDLN